jgi:hypothetical protein
MADLRRLVIEDAPAEPLMVADASANATDLRVVGAARDFEVESSAVALTGMGSLVLDRSVIVRGRENGLGASGLGARLTARDLVVADTLTNPSGRFGYGVASGLGVGLELERVLVHEATSIGVVIDGVDTQGTVDDLWVNATRPAQSGFFGRGVQVQNAARLTIARARLHGNHEASLVAAGVGASGTATDVEVVATQDRGCAAFGCPSAGIAAGGYDRGALFLERFRVAGSHLVGVQVAQDGEVDLRDGLVEDNPIGANVQVPGFDVSRLQERVLYRENGVNLDTEALPVPEPTGAFGP